MQKRFYDNNIFTLSDTLGGAGGAGGGRRAATRNEPPGSWQR